MESLYIDIDVDRHRLRSTSTSIDIDFDRYRLRSTSTSIEVAYDQNRPRSRSILIIGDFDRSRCRSKSISIEVDIDRSRCRSKSMSIDIDVDIKRFHKFRLKVCFSESARKMMQNGGRVVAIGPIFVVVFNFWSLPIILREFGCKFVCDTFIYFRWI